MAKPDAQLYISKPAATSDVIILDIISNNDFLK